jgi:hypothetical protein
MPKMKNLALKKFGKNENKNKTQDDFKSFMLYRM